MTDVLNVGIAGLARRSQDPTGHESAAHGIRHKPPGVSGERTPEDAGITQLVGTFRKSTQASFIRSTCPLVNMFMQESCV